MEPDVRYDQRPCYYCDKSVTITMTAYGKSPDPPDCGDHLEPIPEKR